VRRSETRTTLVGAVINRPLLSLCDNFANIARSAIVKREDDILPYEDRANNTATAAFSCGRRCRANARRMRSFFSLGTPHPSPDGAIFHHWGRQGDCTNGRAILAPTVCRKGETCKTGEHRSPLRRLHDSCGNAQTRRDGRPRPSVVVAIRQPRPQAAPTDLRVYPS